MSTWRKDDYKQIEQEAQNELEALERLKPHLQPEKDVYEDSKQMVSNVYRILDAGELHEGALSRTERQLKFLGCDFIRGAYVFLKALDCPGQARDFMLIMLAISGGNSERKFIITDEYIKKVTGLSTKTIQRKRKELKEWQYGKDWKVLEIYEHPRDKVTRQFPPTEYRVLFADYLVRFIREMREIIHPKPLAIAEPRDGEEDKRAPLWSDMQHEKELSVFPDGISDADGKRIAMRISGDFENAPIPPRAKSAGYKSSSSGDRLTTLQTMGLKIVGDGLAEARARKLSPQAWWAEFKRKGNQLAGQSE